MKQVNTELNDYLNNEKHFDSNDMYSIHLQNGDVYYIADSDEDIEWNGHTWSHRLFIMSREQIKLNGAPAVDTLSVSIKCDSSDKIGGVPFMAACHRGILDGAVLGLYRVYFKDGENIGAYKLFEGTIEVSSAGGLGVKLSVKSIIQGLSQSVPTRIFAPQSAYTNNGSGAVVSSQSDTYTLLIPLKPSQRVLVANG